MEDLGIGKKAVIPEQARPLAEVVGSYTYFADGDVLLAKITPCFENGKLGIATGLSNAVGFGSSEYVVLRPGKLIDREWLYYFLSRESFRQEGASRMTGAVGHKRVAMDFLETYRIPVPSIPEQKRIVSILDAALAGIDAAIANTEKNLANARELFENCLNSAFSALSECVERRMGDERLMQIIDGDRGANYPSKTDFSEEGHCLFLSTKNVRPDGFNFEANAFITKEKDNELRKGKLKRRDVVLTTRGTIGNVALYDDSVPYDDIRINSGMLIFRPNESIIKSEYLFEILRSGIVQNQITRFASGAAQPQLPIHILSKFVIPVPSRLSDQEVTVSRLRAVSYETSRLETLYRQKLELLVELKQAILRKAFAGELTANPEKALQEAAD